MVHTFCMVLFWKNEEICGKTLFFQAEAGLRKYRTGGYGRIWVYKVIHIAIPGFQSLDEALFIMSFFAIYYLVCDLYPVEVRCRCLFIFLCMKPL